jgi:deoxyribonuclease-1
MKRKSKFLSMLISIILTFLISTSVIGGEIQPGNTTNDSFNKSKKFLERVVYKEPEHRIDLYCGCQYDEKKDVDFNSCGYQSQKNNTLAHRIEWEHAVAKIQGNINLFVDQAC